MEAIFHEKQEGSLCAQHCLNSLLQGPYFTAVDLSALAFQLDEAERQRMAEGGISTDEYCHFLQQPSGNMDDSGYFSVQVISRALEVWGLEMIPFNSREFQDSRNSIIQEKAFICNFKEHWLTVRKLGKQWFNLNSLLMGPELISDTYLSLFLTQLKQEGYSIFAVCGIFPDCEADQLLRLMPAMQVERPRLLGESSRTAALSGSPGMLDIQEESAEEREQVRHALELSEQQVRDEEEAADLRRAIQLSMQVKAKGLRIQNQKPRCRVMERYPCHRNPKRLKTKEKFHSHLSQFVHRQHTKTHSRHKRYLRTQSYEVPHVVHGAADSSRVDCPRTPHRIKPRTWRSFGATAAVPSGSFAHGRTLRPPPTHQYKFHSTFLIDREHLFYYGVFSYSGLRYTLCLSLNFFTEVAL
uniref:ataxin-3-like isoform X2 n=1 Tax=Myxine glutinosa TaxID=7769 RepID=UPI00358F560F